MDDFKTVAIGIIVFLFLFIGAITVDSIHTTSKISKAIEAGVNPIEAKFAFKGGYEEQIQLLQAMYLSGNMKKQCKKQCKSHKGE